LGQTESAVTVCKTMVVRTDIGGVKKKRVSNAKNWCTVRGRHVMDNMK